MRSFKTNGALVAISLLSSLLSACSTYSYHKESYETYSRYTTTDSSNGMGVANYESRLPQTINTKGQKVILVDPNVHAWGAYNASGNLIRAGLVTAGGNWCSDINRPCRTGSGTFHIQSLGGPECKSSRYPLPRGGAPMPYCMFFNGNQGLHGTHPMGMVEGNESHGCVRMYEQDAEWVRYNFANIGTKVVVKPY